MGIVFQFICSISIPITTGSLFLIVVYNFLFQRAIVEWQQISQMQILNIEKQRLHNYAYLDRVITEIQYQQISSDVTSLYSMFSKINQGTVRINQNYKKQMECHVGLFEQNQCSNPLVYQTFKQNPNYLNLWYHRYITKFEDLSQEEQKSQIENDIFSFYTKAIVYSSQKQLLHVAFAYNGYETSQMISFPAQKFNLQNIPQLPNCSDIGLYTYDPRCRIWYQESLQNNGQVFTIPYKFAFTGVIGMTIAQQFKNDVTNSFLSVLGLDYDLENLIENIFKPQDLCTNSSLFQGYTVFFHPLNNTIFFHKDWNNLDSVSVTWEDLEYGVNLSTNSQLYIQKQNFITQLDNLKEYSLQNINNQHDSTNSNEDPQFFQFKKGNQNYITIVYPVIVRQLVSPFNLQKKSSIVMYVGRVQNDISDLLQSSSWEKRITYLCNFLQPFLILVIIFVCIMHYAAVLIFRIEVPIKLLKTFINQRVDKYQNVKKIPNKIIFDQSECNNCATNKAVDCKNIQVDKAINNKQNYDKNNLMNTSIIPLKGRKSSLERGNQQSEIFIKQVALRKNASLMITCDRNSESLNQLDKYENDNAQQIQFIANNQNFQQNQIFPSSMQNQNCSPQHTQNQKVKQQHNSRYLIQLNSNKLLRKSSDSKVQKQYQYHIFSHLCLKTKEYSHGQQCEEQDEQSEIDSTINQQQNGNELINKEENHERKDLPPQQNNQAFQNSIYESNHPINIIPQQQTPRLENDRDEEFLELNKQAARTNRSNFKKLSLYYKESQQQPNIHQTQANQLNESNKQKKNSPAKNSLFSFKSNDQITLQTNQQPILIDDNIISSITPLTPKEQNKISKKQSDSIHFSEKTAQKFDDAILQTEIEKQVSNYLTTGIEQQCYNTVPENNINFHNSQASKQIVESIKFESKQVKGINFIQRTQKFLKQQLVQIKESAKQFKASITPRQQGKDIESNNNIKIQLKNIQTLDSPAHRKKEATLNEELTPIYKQSSQHQQQLLQQQYEATILQNEFDVEEFMQQQNNEFDTVVNLEDIQSYSHEIDTIVNTFKHLFGVIHYMDEGYEREDFASSLFSLNQAVTIFKYINNISAVGMAYFDIGNLYFGQEKFEEAIERYSISLSCGFQQFEVTSISHFNEVLQSGQLCFDYYSLQQFFNRLYFISLSFKELAVSFHDDIQLIGRDARSNYLLRQAVLHFKTCLRVGTYLKKHQQDSFKLLEIIIFVHIYLSEIYVYLNEDILSECTLKEATKNFEQLILKNRQKHLQPKGSNSPSQRNKQSILKIINPKQDQQIIEETYIIRTAFYYIRGVIQIKKGLIKDGCNSLTNYLEKSQTQQYQKKSLFFLKSIFKKENLPTSFIEKRIEKIVPISYDIYILIDIQELSYSSSYRQSLQLKILQRFKQTFVKPDDKVCIILYNQEFQVLQPLMIFQNNKHWEICFENIKQALKIQRERSVSMYLQNNFEDQSLILMRNNTVNGIQSQHELVQENQSFNDKFQSRYTEWESSIFKSLKEMSLQEIAVPFDISQVKRKSILFSFYFSQHSPISNESKFIQNFTTLLDTFHKQPTIINFFSSVKQDTPSQMKVSQKIVRNYQESSNSMLIQNQFNTLGSFQDHMTLTKNRQPRISINKNYLMSAAQQRHSFINTPSTMYGQNFRNRETTYNLIDQQLIMSPKQENKEIFTRQQTMPLINNNKIMYEVPKTKIKKFHIFTKEQDLFTYLFQKRTEIQNFYILQRRFFK
ncbi:hypothetical protein ABPG72_021595 [Tetrahymena utriculariae]